jgi:hypothetical protein
VHPVLITVTGQQAGEPSDEQVDDVHQPLTATTPSPTDRATILLSWLG